MLARTAVAPRKFSFTPSTSLLCVMVSRIDFQHNGATELLCKIDSFFLALGDHCLDDWNSVRGEKFFRFRFGEQSRVRFSHALDDLFGARFAELSAFAATPAFRRARRDFASNATLAKRARGASGYAKVGMPALFKNRRRPRNTCSADPAREDRFAFQLCERAQFRPPSRSDSVIACGVRMTSKPSLFSIARHDFNRSLVAFRIRVAQNVDRIAATPVRRQQFDRAQQNFAVDKSASFPPHSINASVARRPGRRRSSR